MSHNTPEQNESFRKAWDATNARWKAQQVELVQNRKTGEWYDPKVEFNKLMDKPDIQAVFKRLASR